MPPKKRSKKKDEEDLEERPTGNGNGNGKKLSKDFIDRWKKVDGSEEGEEEGPEPERRGLGLFKKKMDERKGQKAKMGFLGFGPPGSPETPEAEPEKVEKVEEEVEEERPGTPSPPGGIDTLDQILIDLKGRKDDFIQKRKEVLRKEAERPREDLTPHLSKLTILKEEMEKKRKDKAVPKDIFGVGFTPEVKKAHITEFAKDEEKMKSALKVSMDRTMKEGSIIRHLEDVITGPVEAVEDEFESARDRLLDEIKRLRVKGFEGRIKKLMSKIRMGKVFQAENDLVNLKIAMEAQRSREQLKREREERLEAHLKNMEEDEEEGFDLEDIVAKHVKAIELEMDQTQARIKRDVKRMETTGFEHVVRNINGMVEERRIFEAEEQLLELRLALKARALRVELKEQREQRILDRAHETMPELSSLMEEAAREVERELRDLVSTSMPEPVLEEDEEEVPELEPVHEEPEPEAIEEMQCGVCGTILRRGVDVCPACGTTFKMDVLEEPPVEELEEVPLEEVEEEHLPVITEIIPISPELGPPELPEPPELSEAQCGVCGSMVQPGAERCKACGTVLFEPGPGIEEYPALEPVEEGEAFPELVPLEEGEAFPELVPLEEGEAFLELESVEEEAFLVPVVEVRCSSCGQLTPVDTELCDHCGLPKDVLPVLEPVEAEEGLPELVPVGPWELVTEELAPEVEGVPVIDMTEEIEVTEEMVPIVDMEAELVEVPVTLIEAEPWTEAPEEFEADIEWRRLCIRGKRYFEEGKVKEALEAYDDAIEIRRSYEAYFQKGSALLTLGWSNSALDCLDHALEIDGTRVQGRILKARVLESLGRYSEAVDSLDKVLEMDSEHAEAWHLKGNMLMQMGRVKEAVGSLERWVALSPTVEALTEVVDLTKKALAEAEEISAVQITEELAAIEEEELRTRPKVRRRRIARDRGLTNGLSLVNGRGLTNGRSLINGRHALINGRRIGLVNGRPLTNGRKGVTNGVTKGLINGRGLVNGASGLVNGRAVADARKGIPVVRFKRKRRMRAIQALAVFLVILAGAALPFIYPVMFPEVEGIIIDGQFEDWDRVTVYDDSLTDQYSNRDVDIYQYALHMSDHFLSFMIRVPITNTIMNGQGNGVDVAHIFLETDGSANTGYSILGIGADHMLEVIGWEGHVNSARLYTFNTSESRSSEDWNGWMPGPSIKAMSKGSRLEVQVGRVELGPHIPQDIIGLVHISDTQGNDDLSDHLVARSKGTLGVQYVHINPWTVQPGSQNNPFLVLNLTAQRTMMEIETLTFHRTGRLSHGLGIGSVRLWADRGVMGAFDPEDDLEIFARNFGGPAGSEAVQMELEAPLLVQPGTSITLFVTIDILDTTTLHETIGLDLDRTDIVVARGAVTLTKTRHSNSYIGSPSTEIVIDGAFKDWIDVYGRSDASDDTGAVFVPRIDIREYKSHFGTDQVSFYLRTAGEIMSGMIIPDIERERPVTPSNDTNITPGPQPPLPPPELPVLTGADIAIIYLDTDQDPQTGFRMFGVPLGADHMIQIEGKAGIVFSSRLLEYVGPGAELWDEVRSNLPAANDQFQLETQVPRDLIGIGEYDRVDAFFMMTDWEDNFDLSDEVLAGERGQLNSRAVDIIPDTIRPGSSDAPLLGIRFEAVSEDVYIFGLEMSRTGNATDLATGTVHLYEDNGDGVFTALDTGTEIDSDRFRQGAMSFEMTQPLLIQVGSPVLLFLAADVTFAGEDRTLGVNIERDDIDTSARTVEGTFPMFSFVATITTGDDRGLDKTIDYDNGRVDRGWGKVKEGSIKDREERGIDDNEDIRRVKVSDNSTWLNFYVALEDDIEINIHIYIDVDGDGTADYDLVYDYDNDTVRLFSFSNNAWSEVNLANDDRYDITDSKLEMGIEFSYLSLGSDQTINYYATTEDDPDPGGTVIDRGPDANWSDDYVTIPEFKDLIIPALGAMVIFIVLRRRGGRRRASSRKRRRRPKAGRSRER